MIGSALIISKIRSQVTLIPEIDAPGSRHHSYDSCSSGLSEVSRQISHTDKAESLIVCFAANLTHPDRALTSGQEL